MSNTVMVVDDSAAVRQQVRLALTDAGFEVVEAVDGQDGLEKITSMPDLDLVVCDVNMPRMNGLEMLEAAKGSTSVPIIMLTTEGEPALIKRAKAAGARGWIVKPFKTDLLVATAKKLTNAA